MDRAETKDEKDFVTQMMYQLFAPIVGWPGVVEILKDKKDDITIKRFVHQKEIFEQKQCTEYEAMLYLHTATLAGPPTSHWANIYFWLFKRWNAEAAKTIGIEARELDTQEREMLADLRRWIFRHQMERLKSKLGDTPEKQQEAVIQGRFF